MGKKDKNLNHPEAENKLEAIDNSDNKDADNSSLDMVDLAPFISERTKLPEHEVRFVLRQLEKEISRALTFGSVVKIPEFGTFYPEGKKRKRGRKGSKEASKKNDNGVVFEPAKELTDKMNGVTVKLTGEAI